MRDFWLNDHRNEAKKNTVISIHDRMMIMIEAILMRRFRVYGDTHGIGENGSFNNENMCMAKLLFLPCLFRCRAIKMNADGKTSHWINLGVRAFSSAFLLFYSWPFCKIRIKVWKKRCTWFVLMLTTPIIIIKQI